MKSFPMFFRTTGRRVVVAGGGEQAAQKVRLLLKTDARIAVLAPAPADLDGELRGLIESGRIVCETGPVTPDVFEGAALVFVATGCPGLDAALHALAKTAGAVVNVVDRPELCDVTTPSIVDRDPVVVAIGTEGTAPVLGRTIKTRIEELLDPRLGGFAALLGRLRGAVALRVPQAERRAFWRWAVLGPSWQAHRRGAERESAALLKAAITDGIPDGAAMGQIALVGAGPGARDLLTLRAVERLQEADVIYYDRLVDPNVLELARRDAERVYVGKVVGAHAWPQDRISALIVAEAARGRRVVRLKSGDPSIFGRAAEELAAARAAGIPVEIVPGVTAISGLAAATARPLTERGVSDTLVLTTGRCRDYDRVPDWAGYARPGTTLAFYMGAGATHGIAADLCAAGIAPSSPVTIGVAVTRDEQRLLETSLVDLARGTVGPFDGPAIISVTIAKPKAIEATMQAAQTA